MSKEGTAQGQVLCANPDPESDSDPDPHRDPSLDSNPDPELNKSESASSRDTLVYEHGSALSRVNLLRLGRVGLAVPTRSHKHRQPSSIPGSSLCQKTYPTLTLNLTLNLTQHLSQS